MAATPGRSRPPPLTPEAFQDALGVSRETLARLALYLRLLVKWQRAINLVGRTTLDDPWRRHMLDSAQLLALLPPAAGPGPRVIVDLGSGAGFPGLVLAVLGAGEVHLIESNRRKCAFLAEVARATDTRVSIHPARVEALRPWPADVVTARALAPLGRVLSLAAPFVAAGGTCLLLKGRGAREELTAAAKEWKMRAKIVPSLTSASGVVLKVENLSRDDSRR